MNTQPLSAKNSKTYGFTIVEMVIVIIVIGILAGISVLGYGAWRTGAAVKVVKSDLIQAVSAMENSRTFEDAGYPTELPTNFEASEDVTLSLGSRPGGKSYCVQGVSAEAPSKIYYMSNKQYEPKEGTCTITSSTFVGGPSTGYVNGVGTAATFTRIEGIYVDKDGTIYAADGGHLRKITADGTVTIYDGTGATGFSSTTGGASVFNGARGVTTDAAGNIYVISINDNAIYKIDPAGVKTVQYASIHGTDVILGQDNIFYGLVGDNFSGKLISITMSDVATTIAGNATNASIDGQGIAASLHDPRGLARASDGTIYVCDNGTGLVRKVSRTNYVSTYAGSGASYPDGATSPINGWCGGVAVDSSDILYVAAGNKLQSIDKSGTVSTIVTLSGGLSSVSVAPDGNIYVPTDTRIFKVVVP